MVYLEKYITIAWCQNHKQIERNFYVEFSVYRRKVEANVLMWLTIIADGLNDFDFQ